MRRFSVGFAPAIGILFAVFSTAFEPSAVSALARGARETPGTRPSFSLGAGYGVWLDDEAPGGSVGVTVGVQTPIRPNLDLGAEAGYQFLGSSSLPHRKVSWSFIPVLMQLTWSPASSRGLQPMLSAGAGFASFWSSTEWAKYYPYRTGEAGSSTRPDLAFGMGVRSRPSPGRAALGTEAKLHLILDEDVTDVFQAMLILYF